MDDNWKQSELWFNRDDQKLAEAACMRYSEGTEARVSCTIRRILPKINISILLNCPQYMMLLTGREVLQVTRYKSATIKLIDHSD